MNHREPTSAPSRGVGQVLFCLVLLLLLPMAPDRAWSRPAIGVHRILPTPTSYLPAIGAPSLRFLAPAPPPDLVARPPAAAPPVPTASSVPTAEVAPLPPTQAPAAPLAASTTPTETPAAGDANTSPRPPSPILVDELRPRVRAEDFLPYFQIPAEHPGDPDVIVPIPRGTTGPAPLPTSSATYTQSPR